jgi:hypothetical protein
MTARAMLAVTANRRGVTPVPCATLREDTHAIASS